MSEDLKRPNGYRRRAENDDDIARSLHDSLNSAPYPSYVPKDYNYPRGFRNCAGSNMTSDMGTILDVWGPFYHPQCFRCHACNYPITEQEGEKHTTNPALKSSIIQNIPTNDMGLIECRCHPFWSQKYCPSHEHDNTPRCCSCERLESRNTQYISLGDGRCLCLECMESTIMGTGDYQPL
ncbi:Protein DA1-related 1, variant 2 [Salvia divinorum]|uniref:Protein DA1-related 1, variant 2 n=1 Tax=Salvia divinorum TaxID=28513 RepID=A0ABD1GNT4_SALDI